MSLSRSSSRASRVTLGGRSCLAVDVLLVAGADPSHTLSGGQRPADLARNHDHPEIARVLEQTPTTTS